MSSGVWRCIWGSVVEVLGAIGSVVDVLDARVVDVRDAGVVDVTRMWST